MKAYDIEGKVFARRTKALTMQECRDMAARLFEEFEVEPCIVQRFQRPAPGRGHNSGYYYAAYRGRPARIHLGNCAPDWMVCHEVAHHVARLTRADKGHGPGWAAIYVQAVGHVISQTYATRLSRAFQRAGLLSESQEEAA